MVIKRYFGPERLIGDLGQGPEKKEREDGDAEPDGLKCGGGLRRIEKCVDGKSEQDRSPGDIGPPPAEPAFRPIRQKTDGRVRDGIEKAHGQDEIPQNRNVNPDHIRVELGDVDIDRYAHDSQRKGRGRIGYFFSKRDAIGIRGAHDSPGRDFLRDSSSCGLKILF